MVYANKDIKQEFIIPIYLVGKAIIIMLLYISMHRRFFCIWIGFKKYLLQLTSNCLLIGWTTWSHTSVGQSPWRWHWWACTLLPGHPTHPSLPPGGCHLKEPACAEWCCLVGCSPCQPAWQSCPVAGDRGGRDDRPGRYQVAALMRSRCSPRQPSKLAHRDK